MVRRFDLRRHLVGYCAASRFVNLWAAAVGINQWVKMWDAIDCVTTADLAVQLA